ncbi:xanthine dehydrogenase family protein molybdopterin-binding subunit [Hymenobacter sp. DH14]|uniref:Xanthine dehydrogenase family protein molybdopterin-binding subunit n=1 Tax=Hymenobacter cyanobacteriorum TaxID=2926463 RepID=A0A9X2AIS9_9BACT|nr:xanthine dehydrogenase family protein molybdopterin-binding subunit [Hymenobacter cyanobacteriorum]MCI1188980.1 xanthine dehydrogenase family protein molybdopterin-binding subunit [Hymenobacter cyanobacteriorum]
MDTLLPAGTSTGEPLNRVDGRLKVTGQARYAAEHAVPGCVHGVLVCSAVARGRIRRLDTAAAEKLPGVLAIISHLNAPKVPGYQSAETNHNPRVEGQEFRVFFDDQLHFSNQPVALAVAETLEQAQHAAALVRVEYEAAPHQTNLAQNLAANLAPKKEAEYSRGQPDAYKTAPVRVEQEYRTPVHVHNPMEMHAAIALWEGDTLTVYNKTQGPKLAQQDLMRMWQLPAEQVRVHSPFVGGAFGGSSRIWPPEMAAILAAKKVGRPVKVMGQRNQEFNLVGYRPQSIQKMSLGALPDGTLVGITHQAYGLTSRHEQFEERIVHPTKSAYAVANLNTRYRLVPLDMSTPCWTRGPGETTGSFALECAMDELAEALNMDPLALRLKNYADRDPENDKPWSSKHLRECYERGATLFGWRKRTPAPRSMRTPNGLLMGWGMSTGIYKAERSAATARARLLPDGKLLVQSATADTGPGTATIMTQIAADASGVAPADIRFELGDAAYPEAPLQAGSHTATSVGTAVHEVCAALKTQLLDLAARLPGKALGKASAAELRAENGFVQASGKKARRLSYGEVLKQHQLPALEVTQKAEESPEMKKYSGKSFCASFVEVQVHPLTRQVRVSRVVSVVDAGRVLNAKTARSQVLGSVVWGIGMALMEDARLDHHFGRFLNSDLAEYHVPVNADVPAIEVEFINQPDPVLDPIGAKGLGEIGLVGFAAAVANAVYHATGRRVRELPITPDKLV